MSFCIGQISFQQHEAQLLPSLLVMAGEMLAGHIKNIPQLSDMVIKIHFEDKYFWIFFTTT